MTCHKIQYKISPGFEGLERWVKDLPEHFASNGVSIFKDRNEVRVFNEAGVELNVKSFKLPNLVNRFAYVYLRGSKAARSFQHARRFLEAGASTPTPVAYIECLSNGQLKESYYVTLQYNHGFTLRDVLNYLVPDRENILLQWVRFTWLQLHKNGIYHLDYSPGNTLINKEIEKYDFAVVDLNRMEFTPVTFKKGIQNFRQLDTDKDTLRLIAAEYARLRSEPAEKAISLLLRYDKGNKAYRRRKGNFKNWLRGIESES